VLGNDFTGRAITAKLDSDKSKTFVLSSIQADDNNTAQYVAVNDINKDLVLAMADMSIMEKFTPDEVKQLQQDAIKTQPKCLVVDGNWSAPTIHSWLRAAKSAGILTAFEPVSTAKATRLFTLPPPSMSNITSTAPIFPNHLVDLATPNSHELAALHNTASRLDLLAHPSWWRVIDALGIPSTGLRVALALTTSPTLVDEGIPQQSIQLLPFIPTILTKLGPRGVVLTKLLKAGDPQLSSPSAAPYVLARCSNGDTEIGGVYVRLFEPDEVVGPKEVVSVNGVGDTLLGALLAGLVKGRRVEDMVPVAQRAAGLSLKSREAVSPELVGLREEIEAWGVGRGEDDGGWMD
jgi:pseudouridine-5'-phosphate glycosidase/pseudouridine kinase